MPNYFKPNWIEDWKEERKKGMPRYLLLYGFGFGLACLAFDVIVNKQDLGAKTSNQIIMMVSIFLGGGFVYSVSTWFYNEWKLKKSAK